MEEKNRTELVISLKNVSKDQLVDGLNTEISALEKEYANDKHTLRIEIEIDCF